MSRPNIVLILTDHWRGDCLSRLGHPVVETPRLDHLSRSGQTFTRAYSPSPTCVPARRCLMTGLTPASAGMVGYYDGQPWDYRHTLAGELTRAGYQTINIGKTHFHPKRLHLGFEQLVLSDDYHEWLDRQPVGDAGARAHGVHVNGWSARPHHLPEYLMEETWFVTRALDFLQKRDPTRPFFLCLSFHGPHPPWTPPQAYFDQFIAREMPAPVAGAWSEHHAEEAGHPLPIDAYRGRLPPHLLQRARAAYFAYLAYLDAQMGRLLDRLRAHGDHCVLMTSDHGEMLGDHHMWRKGYAYEGSARIPFVFAPPAALECARNVDIDGLVGLEDIMPTLLDVAGAPIPDGVEGRSVLPLVRGERTVVREWYHGEHSPAYQYLIDGSWKYVWDPGTGRERLFDMATDRGEVHDLAASPAHADILQRWRERLIARLHGRPEGFTDGTRLIPGRPFHPLSVRGIPAEALL